METSTGRFPGGAARRALAGARHGWRAVERSSLGLLAVASAALLAWPACQAETAEGTAGTGPTGTPTQTTSTPTGTGGSAGSTPTGGTGGVGGGAGGESPCSAPAFVAVGQDAGEFMGGFLYVAQDTFAAPVDVLTFELVDGTPAVGTLTITDAGYDTCVTCVRLDRDCDGALANCARTLLAQGGRIEVTSSGGPGETFAGTLYEAAFVEVTIDQNGATTPVAGGEQFCQAPYAFSETIQ